MNQTSRSLFRTVSSWRPFLLRHRHFSLLLHQHQLRPETRKKTDFKGKIRNLTSYGAFVELKDGLDGMIHVSDIEPGSVPRRAPRG
jgi:ribosomal protein S1